MSLIDVLGILAAVLTTGSFVPQVYKTLKTKDTSSISLGMYASFVAGISVWLVWGILLGQIPVILANGITLVLASIVLVRKINDVRRLKETRK